jgi:hypothetical protein
MTYDLFLDPRSPPTGRELERRLGGHASALWWQFVADVSRGLPPVFERWQFLGKSYGWLLRLHGGTRTLLYLEPRHGHFVVSFAGAGFDVHGPEDLTRVEHRLFRRAATRDAASRL